METDIVAAHIAELLAEKTFHTNPLNSRRQSLPKFSRCRRRWGWHETGFVAQGATKRRMLKAAAP